MSRVPTNGIDYTSKDYESFRNDMINKLRIKMPEYTDIRQSDAGIVILELLAMGLDVLSYYQDIHANEVFLVTAEQRSNVLKWCQMFSYVPKTSTPSEFTQVLVLSSVQTTDTIIPMGTKVKTKGTVTEPEVIFETASDLVIPAGALGNEQDEKGEYLYTVKVVQGVSITGELLGSSTGSKDQSFRLSYTPVILDSVSVIVNSGSGYEKWNRVDNFVDSTPTSNDYVATINDNDEAVITFGDGVFGKIPPVFQNGLFCSYRVGGGTSGNVAPMKISLLDSSIALVAETFNPSSADVEGQDKETTEEIRRNAPSSFRNIWGALTTTDFAEVVRANFLEVDKSSSYIAGDGTDLNIYVLLKNDATLTDTLINKILSMYSENEGGRKIVGSGNISILPAIKKPVDISATLAVKPRYDFDKVKANVTALLTDFFAVGNYDFDTELSISELCTKVMSEENAIEGIRFFKITSPTADVLTPNEGEIFTLGTLTITNGGA